MHCVNFVWFRLFAALIRQSVMQIVFGILSHSGFLSITLVSLSRGDQNHCTQFQAIKKKYLTHQLRFLFLVCVFCWLGVCSRGLCVASVCYTIGGAWKHPTIYCSARWQARFFSVPHSVDPQCRIRTLMTTASTPDRVHSLCGKPVFLRNSAALSILTNSSRWITGTFMGFFSIESNRYRMMLH